MIFFVAKRNSQTKYHLFCILFYPCHAIDVVLANTSRLLYKATSLVTFGGSSEGSAVL